MRYPVVVAFLILALLGCTSSGRKASAFKLDGVEKNMSFEQVQAITGEPSAKDDLGTATDENGDTTRIVIWYYGENESVTFVNGKVNDVDTDIATTRKRIEHIMDSAKNAQSR